MSDKAMAKSFITEGWGGYRCTTVIWDVMTIA
jgi:hypothetical protein